MALAQRPDRVASGIARAGAPEPLLTALVEFVGRLAVANLSGRLALRPREAAEALGISERRLRQLIPQLPHVRLDGTLLFPVEGLRAWLARESARPEASAGAPAKAPNAAEALANGVLERLRK